MTTTSTIMIAPADLAAASKTFDSSHRTLRIELRIAVGKTLAWAEGQMARQIVRKVRIAQREVRGAIARQQTSGEIGGHIRLAKDTRIELRHFGARQVGRLRRRAGGEGRSEAGRIRTERRRGRVAGSARARQVNADAGVTYQIDRTGGRKLLPQAFIVDRYSGSVFVRRPGSGRVPFFRVWGLSPWGTYARNDMLPALADGATDRLRREVHERIRSAPFRRAATGGA